MKQYTRRQKIILAIYAIISLPLLPLMAILYPFSKWVVQDANDKEKVKLDLIEFLAMSVAMSLYMYLMVGLMYWLPPSPSHH